MIDEVLVKRVQKSKENCPFNLPVRCFDDIGCNINRCISDDYNNRGKGKCCPFYETKCRLVLDSFFKKVYGVSVMERISSSTN